MTRSICYALLAGAALSAPLPAAAQGFYVGAFAGMTVLDATERVGGVKLVDLGGDAPLAGGRAGWGVLYAGGLYLGAEGEAWGASGRSRAVINGEAFSFDLRGGAGAYARAGWMPRGGGALFFARGGVQAIFTSQGTQWLPAVGLGAEVPISGPWSARLDATYAWNDREFYEFTAGVSYRFNWATR